jgi:Chitobiase/beta-hexosaminidase C-terminal domain
LRIFRALAATVGITFFSCFFSLFTSSASAQVTLTASAPTYNFQVLPGSTRQIYAKISGGTQNTINWSVLSTTGGASATFTTPSASETSIVDFGLPTVQVNIGSTAGSCSISGTMGRYSVASTATVTVQAQSVDNTSKTATFLFNVCAKTTTVIVAPAYQQAFKSQHRSLQSWVSGNTDESGTWSIVSQPSGGDGKLADTANRDADFVATVTGRYTLRYTSSSDQSQSATAIVYVSPNAMPSYTTTPNQTEPRECYADPALTGADYEVGAGKAYTTISSVPSIFSWTPGTILRIWNTDLTGANPSVFHEYFQISKNGTATEPIIVCGVPDSLGNLPIMDGNNAVAQADTSTGAAAGYGILTTWAGPPTPYGYWQSGSAGPSYVSITGLHIRNATPGFSYIPPGGGTPTAWVVGASCVNLRSGSYIDVSGNDLDTCTNGFFSAENTNSAWAPVTQDVTVTGNHIHGSGWSNDETEHQSYFQSFYGLYEGNRLDNYLCTAEGSNVKWRGVEGIFRYNSLGFTSGCAGPQRDFDLVDVEDAAPYVSLEYYLSFPGDTNCNDSLYCSGDTGGANVIAAYQESLQKDFVYGNVIAPVVAGAIHYNGDFATGMGERQGVLHFYSNTMPQALTVFDTGNNGDLTSIMNQVVDAQNNIFWQPAPNSVGNYSILMMDRYDTLILNSTTNLYATGSISIGTPITGKAYTGAAGQLGWGEGGCNSNPCPWPLTSPLNAHFYGLSGANFLLTASQPYDSTTFVPASGSAAIGAGTALTGVLATMPVRWNFNEATSALTPRVSPLTIGAEDPGVSVPQTATPTFSPAAGTYSSAQTVAISTTTPSATIYYTTNGTAPTTSSAVYSGPLTVSATETVEAIAVVTGYSPSTAGSAAYTINLSPAATPAFSVAAGTYSSAQTVAISTTTPSATIYYTTNGTAPTTSSSVYAGPLTVSATETLEVIAVATGYSASTMGAAAYTINVPQAATPGFSPAAGTYTSTQTVTISSTTPSATIHYTTNGTAPTTSSPVYSGPITVSATETVEAIAVATGYSTSTAGSAAYTITLPAVAPAFSPAGGTYASAQTVTISTTTPSATIYYTTNGATPTTSSAVYSGPITVSATETLEAIAVATGYSTSIAGSAAYTINLTQVATPAFSPAAGTYTSTQTVTISTVTPSATIHYTTNGTAPTTSSPVYSGPLTVSATETVEAIAVATGYSTSIAGSAAYTIAPPAAMPAFSPAAGTYTSTQTVTISSATPSATIHYTTNGTAPTTSSPVYSGPITVSATETVEALTVATGYSTSTVGSAAYTITSPAATPGFSPAGGTYASAQTVTISTTTPSATIYYTTNGNTPTTGSPVYSGPITVSATETVEAIAVATGYSTSTAGLAAYTINLSQVATPAFSPAAGTYTSTQTVTISSATPSTTIHYTTNGSAPTTSSAVYSGPITVSATETVEAIAVATGYSTSTTGLAAYTITPPAAMPAFSLAAGTYPSAQTVAISTTTPSATIYYTTNGAIPTTSSAVYSGPLTVSATQIVEAIAVATGYSASTAGSATYTINVPQAATPAFSLTAGTYPSAQTLTISTATPSATIYYTTNGTIPTTSSPVYSGPLTISATETVEAIAVASGYSTSTASSAAYIISVPQAAMPAFSPSAGTYASTQTVTISSATPSATIYYTTDGSIPTTSSAVYSGPITVSATETVGAIVVATGYSTSTASLAAYTINVLAPNFSVALSEPSLTVAAGQSGTTTVLVTPQNGFSSMVSLSCSGLPLGASCSFSPATVTPSSTGAMASTTLTVTTPMTVADLHRNSGPSFPGSALAVVLCCFGWKRRRGLQLMLVLVGLAVGLSVCTGCGVDVRSTTVTVIGTHGALQQTASVTLTVK